MRKPTFSEIYMYKNIFWLAFALFLFIPLVNAIPLALIVNETSGNIAYPQALSYAVNILQAAMSFIATYGMLGILAICVTYFGKNAKGVITLALLSPAVNSLLLYVMAPIIDPNAAYDAASRFLALVVDIFINTLIIFVIYLIILAYSKKKNTFMNISDYKLDSGMVKHPYSGAFLIACGVQFGVSVVVELITMVQMFLDKSIGPPETLSHYVYWLLQYAYIFIFAAVGYILMVLIGMLSSKLRNSGKGIYTSQKIG